MRRRNFFQTGLAAAMVSFVNTARSAKASVAKNSSAVLPLPKRPFGETGEYLSIIGFGGIVVKDAEQNHANQVVREAVEAGVNYFDVAPTYGDAELKLGPALEPYRKDVFLACKSTKRTAEEITKEMQQSFRNLRTDYFDLYQLHALTTAEDIRTAFGKGGALEVIDRAKRDGLVKYVGFSSHSVESAMEALENYDFDSILFPVNYINWYAGDFGPQVVEYARSRGAAVLALKSMAKTRLTKGEKRSYPKCWYHPLAEEEEAMMGLRFTLSQPVTAAVPPGEEQLFRLALRLAPKFVPLSEKEKDLLQQKSMSIAPVFGYPSDRYNLIDAKG